MHIRQSASYLIITALMSSPGIVRANDINIQTDNVRVVVGSDGGVSIKSRSIQPNSDLRTSGRSPILGQHAIGKVRVPQRARAYCQRRGNSDSYTQRNAAGTRVVQTQSSVMTTVCQ